MRIQSLVVVASLCGAAAVAGPPAKVDQALLDKGKAAFNVNCAPCHGEKGDGTGPAAVALNPKPRNFTIEPLKQGDKPADVFKTISEGVKNTPMVAFSYLSEDDRWALAHWVLNLRGPAKPAAAPAKDPKKKK